MCLAALSSFIICPVDTAADASAAVAVSDAVDAATTSVDATSSLLIIFLIALIRPLGSLLEACSASANSQLSSVLLYFRSIGKDAEQGMCSDV